jgi:hypothetical protein
MTQSLYQKMRDRSAGGRVRSDVSFDSVETQIYAPKNGENTAPGNRSPWRLKAGENHMANQVV